MTEEEIVNARNSQYEARLAIAMQKVHFAVHTTYFKYLVTHYCRP